MSAALVVAVLLPALAGTALAVGGRRVERAAVAVGVAAAGVAALAATVAVATRAEVAGGVPSSLSAPGAVLRVDDLAALVLPAVTWIGFLVLVFAAADRTRPAARFHGLMLIFLAAVVVTVTTTALPVLLAAWEIMGATSYALIGFRWQDRARVTSGFTAFTVTRAGDLGMYLAAGAVVAGGGSWSLDDLHTIASPWVHVAAAGLLVAGLGKAAQLPFSFWISRAMAGPSAVSALLHSAAMVAMGGYLLLRVQPLLAGTGWAGMAAAWIGVVTAIALGIVALAQDDIKQVLAASTASQLGFVVVAAGVGSVRGGATQLVAHAATKALLFLVAGAWLTALGTTKFTGLRGVAARWPFVGVLAAVGAASLAGLAPLSLWYAKDAVLAAALGAQPWLYVAGLVGAALAAAYSARLIVLVWRGAGAPEPSWDDERRGTRRIPAVAVAPMVVLAIAAAGLGLLGTPVLRGALDPLPGPEPTGVELIASAAIALIVAGLVVWRVPTVRFGAHWLGLEAAAVAVVVTPTLRLAAALARFDDRFAATIDRSATVLDAAAHGARDLDESAIAAATSRIGTSVAALGRLARRPQTGQVHQYYIGATVVIAASAVLLLIVR